MEEYSFLYLRKVRDSNPRYNAMCTPHFECGSFDHSDNFPSNAAAKVLLFFEICNFRYIFFESRLSNRHLYTSWHFVLFMPHLLKIKRTSFAWGLSGTPKISNFWGEEKWRQAKPRIASFILQAHFDEGAAAIHYGVPRKSAAIVWQKDLFRFLPDRARR